MHKFYFFNYSIILWPPEWRTNSLEKTLMLGKIEGRRRGRQKTRWLDSISDSMDMKVNKLQKTVKDTEVWCAAVHGVTELDTTLWLNNKNSWLTTLGYFLLYRKVLLLYIYVSLFNILVPLWFIIRLWMCWKNEF